jgi:hypothetical protein
MYNYHVNIIILSWILHIHNYAKTFKIKISISLHDFILWNFILIQQLVFSKWQCFQRWQTHTYMLTKKKLNNNFLKVYTSYGFSCDSTCTLMWQRLSTWIIMYESMHINWSYDQTIIKLWSLAPNKLPN